MAERAFVTSTEAIEAFRAALIVYMNKARLLLEEACDDVLRLRVWLQNDRRLHWENEVRRRGKKLEAAQLILVTASEALDGLCESTPTLARRLVDDVHAQASVKFHCTHPNARWKAICAAVGYFWRVSPRKAAWKLRFLAKALGKKLLPGPLRAFVLFNFSKF